MNAMERWNELAGTQRRVPNLALRTVVLLLGFASIAFGVALSRATGLGTSPISCIPCVLSFATPLTIGTYTLIYNALLLLVQVVLLRRAFKPVQLLQLPCTLVFSALIDLFVPVAAALPFTNYPACLLGLLVSVLFTAFGVFLEVRAALVPLPGEGVVLAVSQVARIEFSTCKVAFDSANVAVGTLISLVAMHGLAGVREGTIIAALGVGMVVRFYTRLMPWFGRLVPVPDAGERR